MHNKPIQFREIAEARLLNFSSEIVPPIVPPANTTETPRMPENIFKWVSDMVAGRREETNQGMNRFWAMALALMDRVVGSGVGGNQQAVEKIERAQKFEKVTKTAQAEKTEKARKALTEVRQKINVVTPPAVMAVPPMQDVVSQPSEKAAKELMGIARISPPAADPPPITREETAPEITYSAGFPPRMRRGETVQGNVSPEGAAVTVAGVQVFSVGEDGTKTVPALSGFTFERDISTGILKITAPAQTQRVSLPIVVGDGPRRATTTVAVEATPVQHSTPAGQGLEKQQAEVLRENMQFRGEYVLASGRTVSFTLTVRSVTRRENGTIGFVCEHAFESTIYDRDGRVIPHKPLLIAADGELNPATGAITIQEREITQDNKGAKHYRSGLRYTTTSSLDSYTGTFTAATRSMALTWPKPDGTLKDVTLTGVVVP